MFHIQLDGETYYFDDLESAIAKANELASEDQVVAVIASEANNECYSVGGKAPED